MSKYEKAVQMKQEYLELIAELKGFRRRYNNFFVEVGNKIRLNDYIGKESKKFIKIALTKADFNDAFYKFLLAFAEDLKNNAIDEAKNEIKNILGER